MDVKKDIIKELDDVLASIRKAEQNIIGVDSSDKLKVVKKLIDLESNIKDIKKDVANPRPAVTPNTLIRDLRDEKLLSGRAANVLLRSGFESIEDITKHTAIEIKNMRNVGPTIADEIINFLESNGFVLQ